jgi:Ca2+-binding RTX toxin-like protein
MVDILNDTSTEDDFLVDETGCVADNRTFEGTSGNDNRDIVGDRNILNGKAGNDQLNVVGDNNTLSGGEGNDNLDAVGDGNQLSGEAGKDYLSAVGENNVLNGGMGSDTLFAVGDNQLTGAQGRDVFELPSVNIGLSRFRPNGQDQPGPSRIQDFQDGVDRLGRPEAAFYRRRSTNPNRRRLRFNELAIAQEGADTTIRYRDRLLAILQGVPANQISAEDFTIADFQNSSTISANASRDLLSNGTIEINRARRQGIEQTQRGTGEPDQLRGGASNDTLLGLGGTDDLVGRGDRDLLRGGQDNDTLDGGARDDVYVGGGGQDVFVLRRNSTDTIRDFSDGQDQLRLSSRIDFDSLAILQQGRNTVIQLDNDMLAALPGV